MHTCKKLLILVLSVILLISLSGCHIYDSKMNDTTFWGSADDMPTDTVTPADPTSVPTDMSDSQNWTIMMYINGSNLESEGGEATANLQSLLSIAMPESVNVLVYTGGTAVWQNDLISPEFNQIWRVIDQDLVLLETLDAKSMGESDTLSEFLNYAQTYFPADKKALFFWNHGGGSIMGFGSDEIFESDSLWLSEMASGFSNSFDGQKFDVIGFDACLMASLETASILEPYGKYMVGSEEIEPGGGWNYEYLFSQLAQTPAMTGADLGIVITDGYYQKYLDTETESIITCSVIDLSKIPAVEASLAAFTQNLGNMVMAHDTMTTLSVARQSTECYGDAPGQASFDMIDLYNFAELQNNADPILTQNLLSAIQDAVLYEISGFQRKYSYGLSIYFPFDGRDYFDYCFNIYQSIDFCPEYIDFAIDFANNLTDSEYLDDVPDYDNELYENPQPPNGSFSETGSFYIQLTDEEMEYMCYVYCVLEWYQDDGSLLFLGYDSDLTIDFDTNTIYDNFSGSWTVMNGQPVAVYVMEETDDYVIYNIPVLYNDELAVVKGAWIWDDTYDEGGYYSYNGIYYTNDEFAPPSSKLSINLQIGDAITPLYSTMYSEEGYDYYVGDTFYVDEYGLYLEWNLLPDGLYDYGFMFIDVYGNYHYSDFIQKQVP